MLKKINILFLTAMLCGFSLYADDVIEQKNHASSFAGNNGCRSDFEEFKHSVEHAISERLKCVESELAKTFCDRNEFIRHRLAALMIALKEFAACQQRATNANLKDFIACQFNKTEERIQEDIVHKVDCLQDFFCKQLAILNDDLDKLACWLITSGQEMGCINSKLAEFITVLNESGEGNPFNGAFNNVEICFPSDKETEECSSSKCTTTC